MEGFIQVLQRRWLLLASILLFIILAEPSPTQRHLAEAVRAATTSVSAGKMEAGLENLENALAIYPASDSILAAAASVALSAGEPALARTYLSDMSESGRLSTSTRCISARIDLQEMSPPGYDWPDLLAQCPAAAADLKAYAYSLAGDGPLDELTRIADALQQAGLREAALDTQLAYRRTLADPLAAAPLLRELAQQGDALALDLLTRIQDTDPEEDPAYLWARIGEAFARQQQWALAASAFKAALAVDETYIEALAYLGLANEMLGEDGRPELEQAAQAAPTAPLPHVFLAQHWLHSGELEIALGELELAGQLDPSNPAIAAELGEAYARAGKHELAIQAYRAATELEPMNPEFWMLFAGYSIKYEVKLEEIGVPAARNALVLEPESTEAAALLGYAQLASGDSLAGERLILRAVNTAPYSVFNQFALGMLLVQQGEAIAGLAAMRTAVSMEAHSAMDVFALQTAKGMLR